MPDESMKKYIDYLKNFGFAGETEVVAPGINSKMDEVRSAYGILNLDIVDSAIEARKKVAFTYRRRSKMFQAFAIWKICPASSITTDIFPYLLMKRNMG